MFDAEFVFHWGVGLSLSSAYQGQAGDQAGSDGQGNKKWAGPRAV